MDIKEFRNGSIVKFKDRVCNIENINGNVGMLYMSYYNGYYCGAKIEEVEPLEITKETIIYSGYDEILPGKYKFDNIIIEEKENYFLVKIQNMCECKVKYWHELQMIQGLYENKEY